MDKIDTTITIPAGADNSPVLYKMETEKQAIQELANNSKEAFIRRNKDAIL